MTSLCHSITKLSMGTRYSACPLLRLRCKHMFLQMHSMNDPNQSLSLALVCPMQGVLPLNPLSNQKSSQTVVDMFTGSHPYRSNFMCAALQS